MTRRRGLAAVVTLLAVVGVLLIPTASEAATARVRLRVPRFVTTTTLAPVVNPEVAPVTPGTPGTPGPVTAEATVPGFTFGPFKFFGITVPSFTTPAIEIPDFPGSQFVVNLFSGFQNLIRNTLCTLLGGTFCAST